MKKLIISLFLIFSGSSLSLAQIEDPKIEESNKKLRAKVIVYTKTGEIYKGFFISQNKDFLEIETESVGTLQIPTNRIKKIESLGGNEADDFGNDNKLEQINAVRYMVGTSAFNYKKGENYIRNNPMTFHRGLSDNFSIGVGTSIWALVFRVPILYVNPQFTTQLGKYVHYKVGLDAFAGFSFQGGGGAAAILNTGFTVGEPDLNITGTVYLAGLSGVQSASPFYSLAGMARVSKKLVVVTEGFYLPSEFDGNLGFVFYGGRYLTETASYDIGFLYNQQIADIIPTGIPFIAITVKIN
ncbi:hypothetical protein [Marivirga sp.]|uniref:hypothetical protein n=1 Tax=Marivirga sp. TaxID=2018662 RepID=UPI002D80D390|nr:hypothetical protein [Marivirga sp.]HET8861290.1 hypothetical protein [Marivirga sp.]